MEQIRYVKIPVAETRTEPDTHVEYALQVQGPVRSWTVWHRYNDFLTLAYELTREFPDETTPTSLPPKSLTSWFSKITTVANSGGGSSSQLEFIEERRHGLERYIQGMITCEDDRWRTSSALQRFLAPAETGSTSSESAGWVTAASWLDDQRVAEHIVRDVRQSILRRENALTRNEVSVSHQCTLQAKRRLMDLGRVLKTLEQGLEQISASLTAGELLRRQDMLMALNEEKANLTRMTLGPGVVVSSSDKAALLEGASSDSSGARQKSLAQNAPRSRRVFGNSNPPPQETNITRGLDNQGLLQLQEDRMKEQDLIAADFSRLLRKQKEMGVAIGDELDLQNQLLSELDQDLDRTGNKLATARRQATQLR
ncbi:hypothetical protein GQ54DRAFT_255009 [Martensiomyces pterosporus]|nr:hypothetical protein GQ54DRAFT_255009 [Martensiomyces pterosporus]